MIGLDLIILILIAVFAIAGYWLGIIRVFFSLLAIVSGYLFARAYAGPIALRLFGGGFIINVLVYFVTYAVVSFFVALLGKLLSKVSKLFFLGKIDRIVGAVIMVLLSLSLVYFSLRIYSVAASHDSKKGMLQSSKMAKILKII